MPFILVPFTERSLLPKVSLGERKQVHMKKLRSKIGKSEVLQAGNKMNVFKRVEVNLHG